MYLPFLLLFVPFIFLFNFLLEDNCWQFCDGFCHISTWISYRYTHVPSLLSLPPISHPIPPLQAVAEHWVKLPVSRSKVPLAIYLMYNNVLFPYYSFLHLSHPLLPPLCPPRCFFNWSVVFNSNKYEEIEIIK